MYKQCITEESAYRQRQLEQCLLELMLTAEYSQITVGDICSKAGIARKSFYRYFSSKEGCLYALIDHAIFDGASYYLPGHRDDSSRSVMCERFFLYWKEQRLLLDALTRNGISILLAQRMMNYITYDDITFRFQRNFHTENALEREQFFVGGIMALLFQWHQTGFAKSHIHMARILSELLD